MAKILKQTKHCKLLLIISNKEAEEMGLLERGQNHKPVDNDAQKEFKGDAVVKINAIKKYTKEGENIERLLVETSVIRAIPDKKGRETTIVFGDRLAKFYREDGGKKSSFEAFFNDMFTAGIDIDISSEETMLLAFEDAKNKLIYLRCWMSEFTGENGETVNYQNIAIKSKKFLTEENSTPEVPL